MPKFKLIYLGIFANFWMILIEFSELCFSLIAYAVEVIKNNVSVSV